MKRESILKFLKLMNAKKVEPHGKWIKCSCLMAPWWHKHAIQNTTSFGIEVNDSGPSRINCFACGAQGDLMDLLFKMRELNHQDHRMEFNMQAALQLIATDELEEEFDAEFPDYEEYKASKKHGDFFPFPEDWLASFIKKPDHWYLEERGISVQAATTLDARWDPIQNRICFPIRTHAGVLAGLQGRWIHHLHESVPDTVLRYNLYNYKGHYNPSVWANENRIRLDLPVVMGEGWFDIAKIFMCYENVVGSLTSKITKEKALRLQDATEIITFYDHGTGGDCARDLVDHYYGGTAAITHIIPDEDEKDAGAMPVEQIAELIESVL